MPKSIQKICENRFKMRSKSVLGSLLDASWRSDSKEDRPYLNFDSFWGPILELKIDIYFWFFRFTTPLEAQRKLDESSVASRSLSFGLPTRFWVFFGAQVTPKFGQNLGPKRNVTYNRQNAQNTIKTNVFLRFLKKSVVGSFKNGCWCSNPTLHPWTRQSSMLRKGLKSFQKFVGE